MLPEGNKVIQWLSSTQTSLLLFGLLAAASIPGTLLKSQREYYNHPLFLLLLSAFTIHLLICTIRRWKTLARTTIIVHAGVLITITGAFLTGRGYVATINIYEGEGSNTVYRWDLKQDVPFSHEIRVRKINTEFHPVPLQIGVMKGENKHELKVIKTGESFTLDGYDIKASHFDPWREVATISVTKGGVPVGSADTLGISQLPADFPFSFKLVAFQDAVIKRFWVDIDLLQNGHVVTSGVTEINHPFNWNGLDFFNTEISLDPEKRAYAGIQIVKDPGKHVVYLGMLILACGTIAAWHRRFRR